MSYGCDDCRSDLPARDAGGLSSLQVARVDQHLQACASCRALRARLAELVQAGRAWSPAPTREQRDALCDALTRGRAAPVRATRGRRWARWLVPLAAAAALAGAWLAVGSVDRGAPERGRHPGGSRSHVARAARATPPPDASPSASATGDTHVPGPAHLVHDGLEVRATPGTRWELDAAGERLFLREGTLYAEYRHRAGGRPIVAEGPGVRVTVTGTVFFLSTRSGAACDVGVVRGRVVVQAGADQVVLLEEGHVVTAGGAARPLTADESRPAAEWFGVAVPPTPVADGPSHARGTAAAGPTGAPSAAAAYAEAEAAMARGDVAVAASTLEGVVRAWPATSEARTARLELARLYAGALRRPERAAAHLRAFLASGPQGGPAEAARAELCRILPPDDRAVEPGCREAP